MRTYTVIVTWMEATRSGYRRCSRIVRQVLARSCTEAGDIALAPFTQHICAAVSCVWYDWPQEKS